MAKLILQQSDIPPFDSDYMQQLAYHLWQMKMYWHDARRPLELKWRECDEAYLCYRRLPSTGGMDWVDDSEFGETDIFDNVNLLSLRMSLALMPRNYSWLTVSSRASEAQEMVQSIQDQQIFIHKKARSRRQFSRVIKQNIVRGTTALLWDWRENKRYRRLSTPETQAQLAEYLESIGADPKEAKVASRARIPEITFSGPHMRPLDVFDLWIDPYLDLTNTPYPATIVQTFHFLPDIHAAVDDTGQPIYKNLEGLNPFSVEQIYAWDNNFRMRSPEVIGVFPMFGLYPARITGFTKLVPIYTFHFPYLKFKGHEFFDTYFHVALNNGFRYPRIIRVEENPNDSGHSHVLIDNYIDWYTNIGWGISGVEKALTYYRQKNLLQAIWMNAATASQFPASLIYSEAFRDDAEVNFSPGALNEIAHNPLGLKVVEPVPAPANGVLLGMKDLQWAAQEIRSKMGIDGLTTDSATRSMSKEKTATEVNSDQTTGSTMLDDFIEKTQDMLTDYCQGVYDASRKWLRPDDRGMIQYQKMLADRIIQAEMPFEQLDVDRTIQVMGSQGMMNKGQDMQNLVQALQLTKEVGQTLPNAANIIQKLWVKLMEYMNVQVDPQDLMSPQQLAAVNPQVQMAALQGAVNNPQMVQAMLEQQHKARQLAFDQQQRQQEQAQAQAVQGAGNVQAGANAGAAGPQAIPNQGF